MFKSPRGLLPALLSTLAAFAPDLDAQTILLRGKIEQHARPGTFVLACSGVLLEGGTASLKPFVGLQVELRASLVAQSPVRLRVAAVKTIARGFEIGGNARLGRSLTFHVTGTPGSFYVVFAGARTGFLPFGTAGTWFLSGGVPLAAGRLPAAGTAQFPLPIPNAPKLAGLTLYGQAVLWSSALYLTNPDCKTLRS